MTLIGKDIRYPLVSEKNSSTAPLSANGVFVGTGELDPRSHVLVTCKTDVAGSIKLEFSPDGTNWDSSFPVPAYSVAAGVYFIRVAVKGERFFRVRYTNGSTQQTYFRLHVEYGTFSQLNAPLGTTLSADADAIVTRSVSTELDLAFGRFGGMTLDEKFGFCAEMDAGDAPFDLWYLSTDTLSNISKTKTFLSASQVCYLACSDNTNTNDVVVIYLDADGAKQSTTITLTGNTPVATPEMLDCNVMELKGGNGDVYLSSSNSFTSGIPSDLATILAFIPSGIRRTQQTHDRVPAGKKRRIRELFPHVIAASGADRSALLYFQIKPPGYSDWVTRKIMPITNSTTAAVSGISIGILPALTQMRIYVAACSDTGDTLSCDYTFEDVDA